MTQSQPRHPAPAAGQAPPQNKTLGIALIGCGGMASNYRDNYSHIPGTAYRLVVDVNGELAQEVAATVGAERFSTNWQDALADDVHLADISTPNHLHAEQAVALLHAGKHVILQKPMAPTLAECRAIVEAANKTGRQAGVYMSDLEDPVVWDIREIVQSGLIGQVTGVRCRYAHRGGLTAKPAAENWRGSAEKTGGGAFMQLSIHHTNLVSWLLNDTVHSVMAYAKNLMCPHIGGDDTTTAVCEFGNTGVLGVFESSWNADGNGVELYGSEGSLRMLGGQGAAVEARLNAPFRGRVIMVEEANVTTLIPSSGGTRSQCRPDNPLNQHIAFVQSVREGNLFPVTAEIGMQDVAVVKAVYHSAETGRRINVIEML